MTDRRIYVLHYCRPVSLFLHVQRLISDTRQQRSGDIFRIGPAVELSLLAIVLGTLPDFSTGQKTRIL